jgi:hypothetical protein
VASAVKVNVNVALDARVLILGAAIARTSYCPKKNVELTNQKLYELPQLPAMENALLLDAAEYFDNPDLSDVTITIREEALFAENSSADAMDTDVAAANQEQQQQRQIQMPSHKVLLSSCSSLYKSMVSDAWGAGVQLLRAVLSRLSNLTLLLREQNKAAQ